MDNHFIARSNDSENNASFVTMATANQMISPEAPYNNNGLTVTGDNQYYSNYSNSQYTPHITTTPVVKSHHPTAIATNLPMFTPPPPAPFPLNYQHNQQPNYTPVDMATFHIMNMEIDDYFTPTTTMEGNQMFVNTMHNVVYSPSSTSVTTNNSSIMMIDTMSPTSPTHNMMMSPEFANQAMDTAFMSPTGYHQQMFTNGLDNHVFSETPIVPTNIGMHSNYSTQNILHYGSNHDIQQPQQYVDRKNRRPLPRRHTVSTPYSTSVNSNPKGKELINESMNMDIPVDPAMVSQQQQQQPSVTKSRKSSLKAKRHRSLGKLDIYGSATTTSPPPVPDIATFDPLSAKLELWTHEQLLERVMELEKEKQVAQTSMIKQKDECAVARSASVATAPAQNTAANAVAAPMSRKPSATAPSSKARSASHTDTELDDDDDEDEETLICKWDACSKELNSLDELINHVKSEHIGSGKANYYCLWKDCARNQKPFTKRHKMHNHLRTHTGERPFMCQEPDCGKRFSRPDSLTTHAKIHSNIRPYICTFNECGKAYYHLRSLRKHERTHTSNTSTTQDNMPKSTSSSPPPPVPPIVMPVATSTDVAHATSLHPADELLVGPDAQQVFSDWGLAAQAAVFNVMERENTYM
ncbi:uncharacterized protein ATC70_012262 [Mucor velutinosus]|uniref:C2H2-type domain-containing protein n=1 Tax=Mucor velutinosus TaxID=708070 RepID=A0AAN7D599_9FUNG|nr:hypothetical protein ATC70_012262 [Mucor velutinosus]